MRKALVGAVLVLLSAAAGARADDDAPDLPRVVPPSRRVTLEPIKQGPAVAGPTQPADLLAAPSAPPAWWERSTSPVAGVVPSGLPGPSPAFLAGAPRTPAAVAASAAPAVRPMLRPLTASGSAARAWPAAFAVRKAPGAAPEIQQATHVEVKAAAPDGPAPTADDAAAVADLKQRVETLYGRQDANAAAETQPDGSLLVRVRGANKDGKPPAPP